MAYNVPCGKFVLYKGVPLDNRYTHVYSWKDSPTDNREYIFNSNFVNKYFNDMVFINPVDNTARLECTYNDAIQYNYCGFQNTAHVNKWFYAFIKEYRYINESTTEISFEIDVMTTYHYDYYIRPCLVLREHSLTDIIGSNLEPENVPIYEYVSDNLTTTERLEDTSVVIAAPFNADYNDNGGGFYSGLFCGLNLHAWDNDATSGTAGQVTEFILGADEKQEEIVSIYLAPKAFVSTSRSEKEARKIAINKTVPENKFGAYVPRNKKLFTHPYRFLYVSNQQGTTAEFKYEYFNSAGNLLYFILVGDIMPNPSVIMYPRYYKGIEDNYDEKIILSGYPQLPYMTDSYRAWIAQNGGAMVVEALGTALLAALAPATGGLSLAAAGGMAVSGASSLTRAAAQPNHAHAGSGGTTLASAGMLDFIFMDKRITEENARVIDDYFDVFGYACNKVKEPNRLSRDSWNYVQTKNCVAYPMAQSDGIPADVIQKICSIYDKGVTFWHSWQIGNYTLPNIVKEGE